MEIKKIFSNKNLVLLGQIIFWLYFILNSVFNFFINFSSYNKVQTFDKPIMNVPQVSSPSTNPASPMTIPLNQLEQIQ
jgi:hypothetical protein